MKKNKMIYTILTGTLVLSAAGSMHAFAQEDAVPVASEESGAEQSEEETAQSQYMTVQGKIESIQKEENYYTISTTNDDMGMVFTVEEGVFVINSEDGAMMGLEDLTEGMEITAIVSKNSPMTMSIPPITPGAVGFVAGSENNVMTGYFDETLTSQEAMLSLNISEETKIVDVKGTKQVFTQDSVKNQDCLVLYGITTRSIPAQTTPDFVMLLNVAEESENTTEESENVTEASDLPETKSVLTQKDVAHTDEYVFADEMANETVTLLPLRDTAEQAGFTVTWNGNDKPVLLEKDGVQIEVVVGSAEYKKENTSFTSEKTTVLQNSKIYIGSDIAQQMTK